MSENLIKATEEGKRLAALGSQNHHWRKWGPYLSERQWGTVREDYSADGSAWEYFPHDHARKRAYRWGEDGIAGISDELQLLCFSLNLWNGKDPFLKERLFGLTGHEGNHGEDVKEYSFYLDNLPTHCYMRHLYKYPQEAFPYDDLLKTNANRSRNDFEYELLDTKIFDDDRYFDVFTEYAKESDSEILIRISVENRSDQKGLLYLLPTLLFRNTWSFVGKEKPKITSFFKSDQMEVFLASHPSLGDYFLYSHLPSYSLFTENETNKAKLYHVENDSPYVKDGINDYLVESKRDAVNPNNEGTKASYVYRLKMEAKEQRVIRLRLSQNKALLNPFDETFDALFDIRKKEADAFYEAVTPYPLSEDMRAVQRQAFAGLLWNKQCYHYNVRTWLAGDPLQPPPPKSREKVRNFHWPHLDAFSIMSMPDKWEYPWFAAWDLGFHAVTYAMIDPDFAKEQLLLLTKEWFMAPDGQIPAYEWNFSDVNPPVTAWAAMRVYQIERCMYGNEDRKFLEKIFQKLMLNFTWWVNRKDSEGRNIFEGGFLGLDNIGVFDRSLAPPSGGILAQPDATAWMGTYCLNCLQIALELAIEDSVYEDIASKFFEHFVFIADAINRMTGLEKGLWDDEKGFYYGLLIMPDGSYKRLYQENITGAIPLFAVATNETCDPLSFPNYRKRQRWLVKNHPEMLKNIADMEKLGMDKRILLAFATEEKLIRVLEKILDPEQFLSPFGIRSASKRLAKEPFIIHLGGKEFKLDYEPAESTTPLFGGNSNWRGPIWFPLNFLLIESLQKFDFYYGDHLKVKCPKDAQEPMTLWDVSHELSHRLVSIFLKDKEGKRPVFGGIEKFQTDPHFKDYLLFHEYFHGDNGAGLGASNQTGWTALVAKLIHQIGKYEAEKTLFKEIEKEKIGSL